MLLSALNQFIDVIVDAATGRLFLLPALIIVGVAFLIGALRLYQWRFGKAPLFAA